MTPEEQQDWKHKRVKELQEYFSATGCTGFHTCDPVRQLAYMVADLELKAKMAESQA